jgi:hypothetical protein
MHMLVVSMGVVVATAFARRVVVAAGAALCQRKNAARSEWHGAGAQQAFLDPVEFLGHGDVLGLVRPVFFYPIPRYGGSGQNFFNAAIRYNPHQRHQRVKAQRKPGR